MAKRDFAHFIKTLRQERQITQQQLADQYGVSFQAVSKWENGRNLPELALVQRICNDYHVRVDDVLAGEYRPKRRWSWRKTLVLLGIILMILAVLFYSATNLSNNVSGFEFRTLSTRCRDFELQGSISYDEHKTAVQITSVEYHGENAAEKYSRIECDLYEKNGDMIKQIAHTESNDTTMQDFLHCIVLTADGYQRICDVYNDDNLSLVIAVTDLYDKTTIYEVPLVTNHA